MTPHASLALTHPSAPSFLATGTVGAALVLIAAIGLFAGLGNEPGEETDSASPSVGGVSQEMRAVGESLARRDPGDPTAMGALDAPVVLIAYSDCQCPFCGTWVRQTQPELVEHYVDEGMLRIEWREFPYLGETSRTLAVGARAAAEQDMFWEYHETVYASSQKLEGADSTLPERMAALAADAGLDRDRFTDDLGRDDLAAQVDEDFHEGQRIGVSGTPTFLINGAPIMGAQPLPAFTSRIDDALAATRG